MLQSKTISSLSKLATLSMVSILFATQASATFVDPKDKSKVLPYVSERTAPRGVGLPTGEVVPDDFCLPGKLDACGDHLRDGPQTALGSDNGPVSNLFGADWTVWGDARQRTTTWTTPDEASSSFSATVGVDRRLSDGVTVGVMAGTKSSEYHMNGPDITTDTTGYFVGPYFILEPSSALMIDGRVLFGQSDNDVVRAGASSGSFGATSTTVVVRATSQLEMKGLTVFPSIEYARMTETAEAYTDAVSGAVAETTTTESFLTLGALAQMQGAGVSGFQPYVGVEGHYRLDGPTNDLFATIRVGASLELGERTSMEIEYIHGALGLSGVEDSQVSVSIEFGF